MCASSSHAYYLGYAFLIVPSSFLSCFFFFFNDTATTEIYTLSLHDALPISFPACWRKLRDLCVSGSSSATLDRKSTRLNSSHEWISYAVFCLKKKKKRKKIEQALGSANRYKHVVRD